MNTITGKFSRCRMVDLKEWQYATNHGSCFAYLAFENFVRVEVFRQH
jgi:hypothetical protein